MGLAFTFKNNFKNPKKKIVWETIFIFEIFYKKIIKSNV